MTIWLNECTSVEGSGTARPRLTIGLRPRAYRQNGSWRVMQSALGQTGDPELPHGLSEHLAVRFADKLAGQSPIVHVGRGAHHIRMTAVGTKSNVAGSVVLDGAGVPIGRRWNGAWAGADLEYLCGGHYLRKNVYLQAGHPSAFEFRLDGQAGVLSPSPRGWDLLDDAGRPVLWVGAGYLSHPANPLAPVPVPTSVRVQGGKSIYRYELPAGDWAGWALDPTWTSQPGAAAGLDTTLYSGGIDNNYGITNTIYAGANALSEKLRGLLQFSLTGLLGTVSSATLTLTRVGGSNANPQNIALHRALTQWFEGNRDGIALGAGVDGSTWHYRNNNGTVAWGAQGGQSGTDYVAAATATTSVEGDAAYTWNVAADLRAWLAGTANYGWLVLGPETVSTYKFLASSDHATAGSRPLLSVTYTLSGGGIGRGRGGVLGRL